MFAAVLFGLSASPSSESPDRGHIKHEKWDHLFVCPFAWNRVEIILRRKDDYGSTASTLGTRINNAVQGRIRVRAVAVPEVFRDNLRRHVLDMLSTVMFYGLGDAFDEFVQEQ